MRRILLFLACSVMAVAAVSSLELDRAELEAAGDADIEFENYEGPVERIDSREAIRGIGQTLGRSIADRQSADYDGRYSVQRIIGDVDDPRRAADVLELGQDAAVDHIVNLRRIIAGYLETAWGYNSDDADLLARFITIYNAVHRGNIDFFAERYRIAVWEALEPARVGLATSYRQWSGNTQIVIPIKDDRSAGDLDAVDPGQLIDRDVISELRTRADLGIDDRKAIIAFIERVIVERTEAIAEERAAIQEEMEEIDRRQTEIAETRASTEETDRQDEGVRREVTPDEEETPRETPAPPQRTAVEEDRRDEPDESALTEDESSATVQEEEDRELPDVEEQRLEEEEEQLAQREEELTQRQAELDEEEQEVAELTEAVEELYQETAEDQAIVDEGLQPQELVLFVRTAGDGNYELSLVDLDSLGIVGEQTVPLSSRDFVTYQGGVLAAHAGNNRLLLLDVSSMEILAESDVPVVPGAPIRVVDGAIFTVVSGDDGDYYVGRLDGRLVMEFRSAGPVLRNTDIVRRGDTLLVQGKAGNLQRLDIQDFQ